MPELIPGLDTQQKTVMVAANDTDINTSIDAEALDGWLVASLVLSGSNMIILYTRTVEIVVP